MVARYGLSEKLINSSNPFDEFRFIRNGRNLPGISLDLIRSEFSFVLGCGQDITESVLHEKLAQLNVHVKWGWEYMSYEVVNNNNEHMIKIELKKVDSDETIVREAIYMIGCDGGHSKIRKTIGAKFDGKFVDYRIAVCDVEVDSDWLPVSW
jgi:2-polyprenyl-6-methoxyphenol hydroxylase-like FAD-dependent oxidoreductase